MKHVTKLLNNISFVCNHAQTLVDKESQQNLHQGPYSQHSIFLITYECSEKARVFCTWEDFLALCNVML